MSSPSREPDLAALRREYEALAARQNRQQAGREFERFLVRLFDAFGVVAAGGFELTGQQIDGQLWLDHAVYLVEAKWQKTRVAAKQLRDFCGKVADKTAQTRGIFVSVSGFTGAPRRTSRGCRGRYCSSPARICKPSSPAESASIRCSG